MHVLQYSSIVMKFYAFYLLNWAAVLHLPTCFAIAWILDYYILPWITGLSLKG